MTPIIKPYIAKVPHISVGMNDFGVLLETVCAVPNAAPISRKL